MHFVDLGESFQTHISSQNLASIQPRTSPVKSAGRGLGGAQSQVAARGGNEAGRDVAQVAGCHEHRVAVAGGCPVFVAKVLFFLPSYFLFEIPVFRKNFKTVFYFFSVSSSLFRSMARSAAEDNLKSIRKFYRHCSNRKSHGSREQP